MIAIMIFYTILLISSIYAKENLSEDGYSLTVSNESFPAVTSSPDEFKCPSTSVIRVKYKCKGPSDLWMDCTRSQCCPGYNLIGSKCISKNVDPCSLNLCEQRCDVILGQVVCTCWNGYRFNPERQKRGEKPTCIDIDECKEGTDGCEQICVNIPGDISCRCRDGFMIRSDNKTCEKIGVSNENEKNANCFVNCDSFTSLQQKAKQLQERLTALETAIKLAVFSSTIAHSVGEDIHVASAAYSRNSSDKTYSVLDSYVQTTGGYCKCQRGSIGPVGPPGLTGQKGEIGDRGPRGPKGAAGNFDFLLLLLADVRHDIILLQERVFPGETLPKFDFENVLKKHRSVHGNDHRKDEVHDFQASKTLHISDYSKIESTESSGDEWDQYE